MIDSVLHSIDLLDRGLVGIACLVILVCLITKWSQRGLPNRPKIYVFHHKGRIGVVLQKDFMREAKAHWEGQRRWLARNPKSLDQTRYLGMRHSVMPTFVFAQGSESYDKLAKLCFVDDGVFNIPSVSTRELFSGSNGTEVHDFDEFKKAYRHIFGKPYEDVQFAESQTALVDSTK